MRNSRRHYLAVGAALTTGVALLSASRASDWPQLRGNSQRSGLTTETVKPPLAVLWRFTGGAQTNNHNAPVISGGIAYFTTRASQVQGGVLFALDTKTGQKKWSFPNDSGLQGGHSFSATPTIDGNRIYAPTSDGMVYVLDATTGREASPALQLGRKIESSPIVEDGIIYFGSNGGKFFALDPKTGERRWVKLDARLRRNVAYDYDAGDSITSSPILAGDNLLFATADNSIHAIKISTGSFRWKARVPYTFLPNGATFAGNSLFIASGPLLIAMLPTSGSQRWSVTLPDDIQAAPAVADGIIYVGCKDEKGEGGNLYAIKDNGRSQWKEPAHLPFPPAGAPVISGDVIYIPAARGHVLAVSKDDGKLLWQYRILPSVNKSNLKPKSETSVAGPLSLADGTLYAVSDDGTLTAFRADAPDSTGPTITEPYPKPGASVNGKPPFTLAAKLVDYGSGLNPDTITVTLDDKDVTPTFDIKRNLLTYKTVSSGKLVDPPLANGRHQATIHAKDWRGNDTEFTWSFVIDNNLPKETRENQNQQNGNGPGGNGTGRSGSGGPGGRGGRGSSGSGFPGGAAGPGGKGGGG